MKKTTTVAAKKTAKKAVKKTAAKKAVVKKTVKKAAKKVAKKAAASKKTTIVANTDVGFGNTLYLRGDGPSLSWDSGVPMDCQNDNSWSITIEGVSKAFEFKLLINDDYWSAGYNFTAKPGKRTSVEPEF